jgi:hypothetical protein
MRMLGVVVPLVGCPRLLKLQVTPSKTSSGPAVKPAGTPADSPATCCATLRNLRARASVANLPDDYLTTVGESPSAMKTRAFPLPSIGATQTSLSADCDERRIPYNTCASSSHSS